MKVLIIEDEQKLRDVILRYFKNQSYLCDIAENFKTGLRKLISYEYDCVIIDLNLPDGDGIQLVKKIREDRPETAILITSARDSLNDRLAGLETGSDDYLTKPFHLSELNARVKAVIRRKTNITNHQLEFGIFLLNLDERSVYINDNLLSLTKKEYDILLYLVRNKNRIVTKESIAEYLWGDYMDDAVSFDFIYAHIKNLRKKLQEYDAGSFLKTVYGVGYKFSIT